MTFSTRGLVGSIIAFAIAYIFIAAPAAGASPFPGQNELYFGGGSARGAISHVIADPCKDGEEDSIPSYVGDKQTLINFVTSLYYNDYGGGHGYVCRKPTNTVRNRIGAGFIIQTMRSDGANYSRSMPSDGEVQDWINKVGGYRGTIQWNVRTSSVVNGSSANSYYSNNQNDVSWHPDAGSPSPNGVIVFYDTSGRIDYMIKRNCGNPIGALDGIEYGNWSIGASSTTNITSAKPGDAIYWTHILRNDGPTNTTANVHSNLELSGFSNGWGNPAFEYAAGDTPAGAGVGNIRGLGDYASYGVTQDDVGNTLCETIRFDPANSSGGRNGRGNTACVSVPYNYTLNTSVNSTLPSTASAGTRIDLVSGTIGNSGPTKSKNDTIWQLTRIYVAPGAAIPGAGGAADAQAPCTAPAGGDARFNGNFYAVAGQSQCQSLVRGGGSVPTSGTGVSSNDFIIDDSLAVGSRVCFALSVRDRSSSDGRWQHSDPRCLTIAKRPKVHVSGGDLVVGRGYTDAGAAAQGSVYTSTTTYATSAKTYGSWSEYGIAASGLVSGMSSAAGFSNGSTTSNLCSSLSLLTLTNTPVAGSPCSTDALGRYAVSSPQPSDALKVRFGGGSVLGGSVDVASAGLASGVYTTASSPFVVNASRDVPAGHWIVINAKDADVRITQNIQYTDGPFGSIGDMPQVVIIGRNISVADSVTRIDAWLIATGTGTNGALNTCDAIGAGRALADNLTSKKCDKQLVVNGPVVAKHLYLYRTAGADSAAAGDQPGEIFNLRPDAYIWLMNQQQQTTRARTVITSELPPRY